MAPLQTRPPHPDELLDSVGSIYDSALESDEMLQALHVLNQSVQGSFAQVLTVHRTSGRVLHSRTGHLPRRFEAAHRQYLAHWSAHDPRAAWLASLPSGCVVRCHDQFDDAFVSSSTFYQQYLIPNGLRWALAGVVDAGPDVSMALVHVRAVDAPPFEDWAAAALRQLLPHYKKARQIRARFDEQAAAGASAVEMMRALPVPCLFTDHAGRCVERNQAFDEAMELFSLHLVVGRVRFSDAALQGTWETALSDTDATALEHSFVASTPNGQSWELHLIPLHATTEDGAQVERKMILVVFEPKAPDAQPVVPVAPGAKLTPAELEVVTSMLHGLPAKVIARQRGASVNTVRSQIVAILAKTGYRSQRELIAAVGASSLGASTFSGSNFSSTPALPRADKPAR